MTMAGRKVDCFISLAPNLRSELHASAPHYQRLRTEKSLVRYDLNTDSTFPPFHYFLVLLTARHEENRQHHTGGRDHIKMDDGRLFHYLEPRPHGAQHHSSNTTQVLDGTRYSAGLSPQYPSFHHGP